MSHIATGEWDLILIPHSSFTLLPVRQTASARFIERELAQLRAYLEEFEDKDKDEITRRSVKEVERAIRRLETKLLNASSEKSRDSEATICWEELGVNILLVDEAHYFKNLYCPTKMTRVSGDAQQRIAARLRHVYEGPLGPRKRRASGVRHLHADLKLNRRMLRDDEVSSARDAGGTGVGSFRRSGADVRQRIIKSLAARAERIAERKVSPDNDNMLLFTTEGRKAALDPRLVDSSAPPDPEGKINPIVENLVRYYRESQDTLGVQAVFIDTNCPRSAAA